MPMCRPCRRHSPGPRSRCRRRTCASSGWRAAPEGTVMMRKHLAAAVLAASLIAPSAALAGVQVRFVNPERYTDTGSLSDSYDDILPEFRTYLQRLGARFLKPRQDLTIDVLHVSLAGRASRGFSDARIMNEATPPSFRLRYVLRENGQPVRSGEEHL